MADPFEYDVFISFSSADEEMVRPVWQALCSSGLRVFWSDSTLKKEVGNSWFEVIEKSLEHSRHMLLVCSDNAMNSKWVKREYRAFYEYCYAPDSRRLIPVLTRGFKPASLPLFLRELQVVKINDPQFLEQVVPLLGGINIEALQAENQTLKEQVASQKAELERIKAQSNTAQQDILQDTLLQRLELERARMELQARQDKMMRAMEAIAKAFASPTYPTDPRQVETVKELLGTLRDEQLAQRAYEGKDQKHQTTEEALPSTNHLLAKVKARQDELRRSLALPKLAGSDSEGIKQDQETSEEDKRRMAEWLAAYRRNLIEIQQEEPKKGGESK